MGKQLITSNREVPIVEAQHISYTELTNGRIVFSVVLPNGKEMKFSSPRTTTFINGVFRKHEDIKRKDQWEFRE